MFHTQGNLKPGEIFQSKVQHPTDRKRKERCLVAEITLPTSLFLTVNQLHPRIIFSVALYLL